jgi:hypothetical protein
VHLHVQIAAVRLGQATGGTPLIHVACQNCGTFDIVGPGHPAVTPDPQTGQHLLTDRTALRHNHAGDCRPGADGNYPLALTFMAPVGVAGVS